MVESVTSDWLTTVVLNHDQSTQMQLLHLVLVYLTRLGALTEDELRGES